jgi:sulfite reductase alpha subunit-like flavoprotein
LLSNTGEGDPPDNSVEFMKALNGKSEQKEIKFSRVRFTVFGLGNTQYQFYNRTAKDVDSLLVEKHKAKRVFKLGLGDNNASL